MDAVASLEVRVDQLERDLKEALKIAKNAAAAAAASAKTDLDAQQKRLTRLEAKVK
jgi:outer membrane murein-binding lipoprotein Lpp